VRVAMVVPLPNRGSNMVDLTGRLTSKLAQLEILIRRNCLAHGSSLGSVPDSEHPESGFDESYSMAGLWFNSVMKQMSAEDKRSGTWNAN
jgi:hypothetical protein